MLISEEQMILSMLRCLPRSPLQVNAPFESDAEILRWKGTHLLVTTDEFSEEDHFREHDPQALGWNCAAGAVTDILAAGGKPRFYAHSLVAKDSWDATYVEALARGCAELLNRYAIDFIGGDFGRSPVWRCTVTVIGEAERPLLRSGAVPGDFLYVTGPVGGGNLEAMLKMYEENKAMSALTRPLRFRVTPRPREAAVIARHASACIDTSDGLFLGLCALAASSKIGFRASEIPYDPKGVVAATARRVPRELLMLCEAGEYELLCSVPAARNQAFLAELAAEGLRVHRVGVACEAGRRELELKDRIVDLSAAEVRARDFTNKRLYIEAVQQWFLDAKTVRRSS